MSMIESHPFSARERAMNKKAEAAMIAYYDGSDIAGLCFHCNADRQVVHVGIHDGNGSGTSTTISGAGFAELITKLLAVEIDALPMTITRTETTDVTARRLAREKARRAPMTKGFIEKAARGLLKKYRLQKRRGGAL